MVRGTLNARRNPQTGACVFTFFDDPGDDAVVSGGPLREQHRAVAESENFVRDQLGLSAELARQMAASLDCGENSTVDIEVADDVYARYFAVGAAHT